MMSETTTPRKAGDGEIDLLNLLRRMVIAIGSMFKAIGQAILFLIVFVLRRWLVFGLCLIAGIGLSYIAKISSDPLYYSNMVLRSNRIPNADLISYINQLHTYCIEDNKSALADALSLDTNLVKDINDIKSHWIIDLGYDSIPDLVDYKNKHDVLDTINVRMNDRINVRIKISSYKNLPLIRDGLISFINKDSLFKQLNRIRLQQDQELLTALNIDILQLDSLRKVKYFEETRAKLPKDGGQMVFLQEPRTQLVYEDKYPLYDKKQLLEADITLYRDVVTIISDFSVSLKRKNGLVHYAIIIVPVVFILTLIITLLIVYRGKVKEVFNKY